MRSISFLIGSCVLLLFSCCTKVFNIQKRKYRNGVYTENLFVKNRIAIKTGSYSEILPTKKTFTTKTNSIPEPEIVFIDTIPADTSKILVISAKVGGVIDSAEKAKYHLFPFWKNDVFYTASFVQKADSNIYLVAKMKDGTTKTIPYSHENYAQTAKTFFNETIILPVAPKKKTVVKTEPIVSKEPQTDKDERDTDKSHNSALWALGLFLLGAVIFLSLPPTFGIWQMLSYFGAFGISDFFAVRAFFFGHRVLRRNKGKDFPNKKRARFGRFIGILGLIALACAVIFLLVGLAFLLALAIG